eukprot:4814964-Karenia_brevis.AAC.1
MLRNIVGWESNGRQSWREIMVRMNEKMSFALTLHPMDAWNVVILKQKMKYGQYCAQSSTFSPWFRILNWNPFREYDMSNPVHAHRKRGRPRSRWDTPLKNYCREKLGLNEWM